MYYIIKSEVVLFLFEILLKFFGFHNLIIFSVVPFELLILFCE